MKSDFFVLPVITFFILKCVRSTSYEDVYIAFKSLVFEFGV